MKNKGSNEQVEKRLVEAKNVDISLSADTILNAYHAREKQKATEPATTPLHKRLSFRLGLSAGLIAVVAVSVSVPLIIANQNKGGSTRLYSVPTLTSSSKKLMFEANNMSGCLNLNAINNISNVKKLLLNGSSDDESDSDEESSESEDDELALTTTDYESIARNYHSLFALLNKSSDTSGAFKQNGSNYEYTSSVYGSTLSLTSDPNNLPSAFEASLSNGKSKYNLSGTYNDNLLSFDVKDDGGVALGEYKEEVNAIRQNRRKFSYSSASTLIYFDADFEDGTELDVEMGINKYENGTIVERMEFESEFEDSTYNIEYSYANETHEYDELEFSAKVEGSSTIYTFADPSYSITLTN